MRSYIILMAFALVNVIYGAFLHKVIGAYLVRIAMDETKSADQRERAFKAGLRWI